jgi:hypothetical protein
LLVRFKHCQIGAFSATYNEYALKKWSKALGGNPLKLFAQQDDKEEQNRSKTIPEQIKVVNILVND